MLTCWRRWPMEWARRSQRVSSRARLIDSASLRRLYRFLKSGSLGGWADVLRAVEESLGVVAVAVESDGYDGAAQVVG